MGPVPPAPTRLDPSSLTPRTGGLRDAESRFGPESAERVGRMVQWYLDHPAALEGPDIHAPGSRAGHELRVQHALAQGQTWAREYRSRKRQEAAAQLSGDERARQHWAEEAGGASAMHAFYRRAWVRLTNGPVVAPEPRAAEVDRQWSAARAIALDELNAGRAASEAERGRVGQEPPAALDRTPNPGPALHLLSQIAAAQQADKALREQGATRESGAGDPGMGMDM